jgi:2-oxoisovalerate dehydrogenase E1 component
LFNESFIISEARFASSVGQGFYTIGPCGEELLSAVGTQFLAKDVSALHYRHVGTSIARQLIAGRTVDEITLDRARGYTCSVHDPITGGRHCAIGGMPTDFYVSSTLASQAPPAVGRALAIPLSNRLLGAEHAKFAANSLSYVSVGDGSINNAHFLAAVNLSKYLQHRQFKVNNISWYSHVIYVMLMVWFVVSSGVWNH